MGSSSPLSHFSIGKAVSQKLRTPFIILLKPSVIAFRHTLILSFRILLVNGVIDLWKKHDLLVLL
jgi:hypothetical protein